MGDPNAGQEIYISNRLHEVHLGHDSSHFAGQRGQYLGGAVEIKRPSY